MQKIYIKDIIIITCFCGKMLFYLHVNIPYQIIKKEKLLANAVNIIPTVCNMLPAIATFLYP